MIKVVFFDVDGTLLSHRTKHVPQSTLKAIRRLQEKGILCVICTGRHVTMLGNLPTAVIPFDGYVTLNGQICLDADQHFICGGPIEGEARERILALYRNKTVPILLVEEGRLIMNYLDASVLEAQNSISVPPHPVREHEGAPFYQAILYMEAEEEPKYQELIDLCQPTRWHRVALDLNVKGGSKVTGVRQFLEARGIDKSEAMAFGDGLNDEAMIRYVGTGVCMGNGEDAAKAVADYVTTDIDDQGIARALVHFGLVEESILEN